MMKYVVVALMLAAAFMAGFFAGRDCGREEMQLVLTRRAEAHGTAVCEVQDFLTDRVKTHAEAVVQGREDPTEAWVRFYNRLEAERGN